jgi:hypothetical protein
MAISTLKICQSWVVHQPKVTDDNSNEEFKKSQQSLFLSLSLSFYHFRFVRTRRSLRVPIAEKAVLLAFQYFSMVSFAIPLNLALAV